LPQIDQKDLRLLPPDCDASRDLDVQWIKSTQRHRTVLECQRFTVRHSSRGEILQRGNVTLSCGPDFPEPLRRALDLRNADPLVSDSSAPEPLRYFNDRLDDCQWMPEQFEETCQAAKKQLVAFCVEPAGR